MQNRSKVYFASDVHLGLPGVELPLDREKRFVRWLDMAKEDAKAIYLLGDIFDFWYEYKKVVPRGFSRFIGKLSELTDAGIDVHFFTGNHDIWAFDYLEQECGVRIHREPYVTRINGKVFFLHHGDGLGKYDRKYKALKMLFTSKVAQCLFSNLVHPNWALWFGHKWSYSSRYSKGIAETYRGEKEFIYQFAVEESLKGNYDFMIFGHRHTPVEVQLPNDAKMFILGDWITSSIYAVFDGEKVELVKFDH